MGLEHWHQWIDGGMDVGSHTQHHIDLQATDDAAAASEMKLSRLALNDSLNYDVRHFCYPYGRFDPKHVDMARDAGYVTATTMRRGRVSVDHDQWALPRVMVACATNPWQFFLKLMTDYEDRRA